jgi:hypothetical protein
VTAVAPTAAHCTGEKSGPLLFLSHAGIDSEAAVRLAERIAARIGLGQRRPDAFAEK